MKTIIIMLPSHFGSTHFESGLPGSGIFAERDVELASLSFTGQSTYSCEGSAFDAPFGTWPGSPSAWIDLAAYAIEHIPPTSWRHLLQPRFGGTAFPGRASADGSGRRSTSWHHVDPTCPYDYRGGSRWPVVQRGQSPSAGV